MSDFTNFRAVYDELTEDVMRSRHQFFSEHLANWFEALDETPETKTIVERLQKGRDVISFLRAAEGTKRGVAGSGRLDWPSDKESRLGTKLLVFREMAAKRLDPSRVAHDFTYAGNNFNDNVRELAEQIFRPLAGELRRYLESEIAKRDILASALNPVPAADRIVQIDHNNPRYREALEALETLERAIKESNLYEDQDEKQEHIAEVSAGRTLLGAKKVRIGAIVTTLGTTLLYIGHKFIDSGLGMLASAAWDLVVTLIGKM